MKTVLNLDNEPENQAVGRLFLHVATSAWFDRKRKKFRSGSVCKEKLQQALEESRFRTTPTRHFGYATVTKDGSLILGLSQEILTVHRWSNRLESRSWRRSWRRKVLRNVWAEACGHELIHACQEIASQELTNEKKGNVGLLKTLRLEAEAFRASPSWVILYGFVTLMLIGILYVIGENIIYYIIRISS